MSEWTIGGVFDVIADAVPDRVMTICGQRRSTFRQSRERTRRLANYLAGRGLGVHRERPALQNWQCGQDRVALIMHNDLYPDAVIGCLKARTVPVNVNHYYSPREVGELLDYIRPAAIVYHRGLGEKFADEIRHAGARVLLCIDDESGSEAIAEAVDFEDALALGDTDHPLRGSPDDLFMLCTGGTTGVPKGVLWRQGDMYVASMSGADHNGPDEIRSRVATVASPWFALSPLMHAAGLWTAFNAILVGIPVVLYDSTKPFDARVALHTAEREKVAMMTMVGDAYAAPLVEELDRRRYDLTGMFGIGIGGAATNLKHQQALLEHLPHITLANGYGSSETGNMGFGHSQINDRMDTFALRDGSKLLSADYTRFLRPGEAEIGWVARSGRIPLGYFEDPEKTQKTFRTVEDQRVVIAGDRAEYDHDGALRLHGRDSLVINTGGEKVFVEEVEEVLRAQPGVADALVVGRASDRWGQEIVALVQTQPQATVTPESLHAACVERLARFKAPKEFRFVEQVRRLGNGKADYRWANGAAAHDVVATTS